MTAKTASTPKPDPEHGGPRGGRPRGGRTARFEFSALGSLMSYLWTANSFELRARVVLALILLVGAMSANVYLPILYKGAVDVLDAEAGQVLALPLGLIGAYGLLRLISVAFGELRDAVFAKVAQRAIRTVALEVFRHLHALSLRFHLDRQTGGLSRAIERGTKGIEFVLAFMLFNIIPTMLEILVVCSILWVLYDFWFAAVTFLTIGSYIAFTLTVTEWRLKYRREMNTRDSEANTKAIDSLLNYETVKYFCAEEHEAGRYDRALERYERAAIISKTSLSALNIGQSSIIAIGLTMVMIMAGQGVVKGTMSIGDFVLVNTYLIQLYLPLNFLGFVYREVKQSLTDMEAMFSIIAIPEEVTDAPGAKPLKIDGGSITFDGVSFGYEADRPILKDVSFTVPAGKTVAIVGPSGAGKSTISRLLFRFYDVTGGTVSIDGQDIQSVTQASVRGAIGIVPQDTVLFNDTIRYNIAYGRSGASDDDIDRAAKLARIDDFIRSSPAGYDTRVGERGLKLSGGEKQRVAIARTILKRPAILVFDEATSALDSKTEKEIQASLREVSAERTTVIIAHRLSTVVEADEIIVLEDGSVVERGRHAELLAKGGQYAAMWARQQEAKQLKETLIEDLGEQLAGEALASEGLSDENL
ncbi:MAG: ABC transporter ATP-binding protein/permease [Proteobacteria bacterium]|nr:ABC transporter ATP-binding protein/permease [Pseudomonadota bacterium]